MGFYIILVLITWFLFISFLPSLAFALSLLCLTAVALLLLKRNIIPLKILSYLDLLTENQMRGFLFVSLSFFTLLITSGPIVNQVEYKYLELVATPVPTLTPQEAKLQKLREVQKQLIEKNRQEAALVAVEKQKQETLKHEQKKKEQEELARLNKIEKEKEYKEWQKTAINR